MLDLQILANIIIHQAKNGVYCKSEIKCPVRATPYLDRYMLDGPLPEHRYVTPGLLVPAAIEDAPAADPAEGPADPAQVSKKLAPSVPQPSPAQARCRVPTVINRYVSQIGLEKAEDFGGNFVNDGIEEEEYIQTLGQVERNYKTNIVTPIGIPSMRKLRTYLHNIIKPDWCVFSHSHPWEAIVYILSGGYTARIDYPTKSDVPIQICKSDFVSYTEGNIYTIDSEMFHTIVNVKPDTWTITEIVGLTESKRWGFFDTINHRISSREETYEMAQQNPEMLVDYEKPKKKYSRKPKFFV